MPCFGKMYCYISKTIHSVRVFKRFYCGHVTYQIWAWFETFKENVNRTNKVNFQCPLDFRSQKKEVLRFPWQQICTAVVVKFLPPLKVDLIDLSIQACKMCHRHKAWAELFKEFSNTDNLVTFDKISPRHYRAKSFF